MQKPNARPAFASGHSLMLEPQAECEEQSDSGRPASRTAMGLRVAHYEQPYFAWN